MAAAARRQEEGAAGHHGRCAGRRGLWRTPATARRPSPAREGREGSGTTMRGGAGWRSLPRDTCTAVDAGAGVVAGGERELKETRTM